MSNALKQTGALALLRFEAPWQCTLATYPNTPGSCITRLGGLVEQQRQGLRGVNCLYTGCKCFVVEQQHHGVDHIHLAGGNGRAGIGRVLVGYTARMCITTSNWCSGQV